MGRRKRDDSFDELQRRKKYKLQDREERMQELNNPAKASYEKKKGRRKKRRREYQGARRLGRFLVLLQGLLSLLFLALITSLDMLPIKYIAVLVAVLLVLWLIVKRTQRRAKKRGIFGKVISIILILILGVGSYYIGVINGAFDRLIGGNQKIDTMVVAVLADDAAETITDAKDYTFGLQHKLGAEDVDAAVSEINKELGQEIITSEFDDVQAQAEALFNKEVGAIIYNEGYTEMLEDEIDDYKKDIKIIYSYDIKKELESHELVDVDVTNSTFSVYLSGVDVYGEISKTSRSDVNIIATVNPDTHQILLTTTPRDMYMIFPGVSDGQRDKLTHAGIYGVDASIAALENFYGIEIPFYARVNFTSVIEIVDRLGGIDVYSEYSFKTKDGYYVEEGMNHFNGEEALSFSRERKNVPGGDNQRGKNQQAVIIAMIKKMISPQMLISATGIINSMSNNVETNMSQDQMQDLIKSQLKEGGSWNIYSVAAEGTNASNYTYSMPNRKTYVMEPNEESIQEIMSLMDRVENGEKLEGSEVAE